MENSHLISYAKNMLHRSHRFHGHRSLSFVFRRGQIVRGPNLSLRYAENPRRGTYRLAIVVSRKVHKSAVTRNRIRRRLYETVRGGDQHLGNYDLVLTVHSEHLATAAPADLQTELQALLQKARLVAPNSSGA